MTTADSLERLAEVLDGAQRDAVAVVQVSTGDELSLDDAYAVQRAVVDRRVARGERRIGVKLGFTSAAKRVQMGVSDVIIGELTNDMWLAEGASLEPGRFVHPRVEPELAFLIGDDVDPTGSGAGVQSAVRAVAPALEIIDSRYHDFTFSLSDVVADNASSAAFVLGAWQPPGGDLGNRGVLLEIDGDLVETGSTAAILGDPWRALHAAVRLAGRYHIPLPAGSVILAGAATSAVPVAPGSVVRARVAGLGLASCVIETGDTAPAMV